MGNKLSVLVLVLLIFLSINVSFSSSRNDDIFSLNPVITPLKIEDYNHSISDTQNEELIVVKSEGFFSRFFSKIFSSSRNLITGFVTGEDTEEENESIVNETEIIFENQSEIILINESLTLNNETEFVIDNESDVLINETVIFEEIIEKNETIFIEEEIYGPFPENQTEEEIVLASEKDYEDTQNLENFGSNADTYALGIDSIKLNSNNENIILKETSSDGITIEEITSSQIWTVPENVTEIMVEAWGAGGAGGGVSGGGTVAGGGGGGGAFAKRDIDVTPGQEFTITVAGISSGLPGGNGNSGGSSSFSNATATYVLASGGIGGDSLGVGGVGGLAENSIGKFTYSGGSGSNSVDSSGAGGGGAGSKGVGGNASGTTAGIGASELGGNGADGLTGTGNGNSGNNYGGAGSGARKTGGASTVTGGAGAQGLVRISYSTEERIVELDIETNNFERLCSDFIILDAYTSLNKTSSEISISDCVSQKPINLLKLNNPQVVDVVLNNSSTKKIRFKDLVIEENMSLPLEDVPSNKVPENFDSIVAIDPSKLNFTEAQMLITAQSDWLYKCKDWNFTTQTCPEVTKTCTGTTKEDTVCEQHGGWTKVQKMVLGEDYLVFLSPVDPAYAQYNGTYTAPYCGDSGESPCIASSDLLKSGDTFTTTSEPNQPNTIDTCADGTTGAYNVDEYIENITITDLNSSSFKPGNTVRVDAWVHCYSDPSADNIQIAYTSDVDTPSWTIKGLTDPCPTAGYTLISKEFVLDEVVGKHAVRAIIEYNGNPANTCGAVAYSDTDDVVFNVASLTELKVTLNSPENNSLDTDGFNFTCSASSPNDLENLTFYWNYLGTWQSNGTTTISGNSNSSTFERTNLQNGEFVWNCLACDNTSNCTFASQNRTAKIDNPPIVVNFTTTGADTWTVPEGVTSIVVEAWGGGGAGGGVGGGGTTGGRGGGGGGAYAKKTLSVSEGQTYSLVVGAGGTATTVAGNPGGDTTFNSTSVVAKGGSGGTAGTAGGAGGSATNSVGDVKYAGGTGGNGVGTTSSGGGGGGAGSTGAGGTATGTVAGLGTSELGGNGGTGRTTLGAGTIGNIYGGAGSGALKNSGGGSLNGGAGTQGFLRITYTVQSPPSVNLISPINNAIKPKNVNFTCSATTDLELSSITFYWNNSGTLIANGTVFVSGTSNSTTFERNNIAVNSLKWNCYACDIESNCAFAISDYSLIINDPPTHTTPILNSTFGTNGADENLTCYNQSTYDPNSNQIKNIFTWYKDDLSFLLLNLPFEGGSNSTYTKDYSGNNRHAIGQLSPTWSSTSGYDGFGSYKFTRLSNNRLVVPNFNYPENFTISLWFKSPTMTGTSWHYMYSHGAWGQNNSIRIYFAESGSGSLLTQLQTNKDAVEMSFQNEGYSNDVWHHYALTVSETEGIKLYLDGILVSQNATAGKGTISPNTNLYIGTRSDLNVDRAYDGNVDDVLIFKTALNEEQILLLNNSKTNIVHSNLTNNDDKWQCRVTPNDRYVDGTTLSSNSIDIGSDLEINIISPIVDFVYSTSEVLVNISSPLADTIWYNWNGTNITYTEPINVTFDEGTNVLNVYANNSLGNISSTFVTFYVDTQSPVINIRSPEARNYYSSNILIDILATDLNLDKVWFNWNGTNTTYTTSFVQPFSLGNYTLHAWANDSFSRLSYTNVSFQVLETIYNGVPYCKYGVSPCVAGSNLLKCRNGVSDGNGPEPNHPNTLDDCTDGSSTFMTPSCGGDESVENITITSLNDTVFRKGDWVEVKATVHCYGEFNFVGLIYTSNASNLNWQVKEVDNSECVVRGYREVIFQPIQLDDIIEDHALRVYIVYDPDGANLSQTCGIRTNTTAARYDDNDDVVFKVLNEKIILNITSPENKTYNVSDILVNISASNPLLDSVWFNWNGTNISYTTPVNITFPDGQHTLIAYANDTYGNIETKNVTFTVNTFVPLLAFTLTLPGQAPVNASEEGNTTAIMNFNSQSNTFFNMNPCVGTSSNCQNDSVPFFVYTNTGNINLTMNINLNQSLPSVFELKANTIFNSSSASIVNTSILTLGTNISPTNTLDVWFFGSFLNAYPHDNTTRTILSNATQS